MENITSKNCSFSWIIHNPSKLFEKQTQVTSSVFSAVDDDLKWYLKLEVNEDLRVLSLCPESDECLRKYCSVNGSAEISALGPFGDKLRTFSNSFTRHVFDKGSKKCKLGNFSNTEMMNWTLTYAEFTIVCELDYIKEGGNADNSTILDPMWCEISKSSLARDIEQLFADDYFSDLTISIKDKNYRVHKAILATRCPVFNTMFRSGMQESQKNQIVITDIEQDTFEEMLHYIYTGSIRWNEFAFELLPAADKYDLKELKSMCVEVLLKKLSIENAARILILADTHNAEELKAHALRFIKQNYTSCKDFNNNEVWRNLMFSNFQLMKDILDTFCKK